MVKHRRSKAVAAAETNGASASTSNPTPERSKYTDYYQKLADINDDVRQCYCYAIVEKVDFAFNIDVWTDAMGNRIHASGVPRKANRLSMQLVDESIADPNPDEPDVAQRLVFASVYSDVNKQMAPVLERGDIVRFHRFKATRSERFGADHLELWGWLGSCGRHMVVWSGAHGESITPRTQPNPPGTGTSTAATSSSSQNYSVALSDLKQVKQMRKWWLRRNAPCLNGCTRIARVNIGGYVDMLVQVIAVCTDLSKSEHSAIVLRVWDGSRSAFTNLVSLSAEELSSDCNRQRMDVQLNSRAEHRAVDVFVFDEWIETVDEMNIKPGDVLELGNVHLYNVLKNDQAMFAMHGNAPAQYNRHITLIPDEDEQAVWLKRTIAASLMPTGPAEAQTDGSHNANLLNSPVRHNGTHSQSPIRANSNNNDKSVEVLHQDQNGHGSIDNNEVTTMIESNEPDEETQEVFYSQQTPILQMDELIANASPESVRRTRSKAHSSEAVLSTPKTANSERSEDFHTPITTPNWLQLNGSENGNEDESPSGTPRAGASHSTSTASAATLKPRRLTDQDQPTSSRSQRRLSRLEKKESDRERNSSPVDDGHEDSIEQENNLLIDEQPTENIEQNGLIDENMDNTTATTSNNGLGNAATDRLTVNGNSGAGEAELEQVRAVQMMDDECSLADILCMMTEQPISDRALPELICRMWFISFGRWAGWVPFQRAVYDLNAFHRALHETTPQLTLACLLLKWHRLKDVREVIRSFGG